MKHPSPLLASLALSTLLLTGCTAATGSSGTAPAPTSTVSSPTDASQAGDTGAAGRHGAVHHNEGDSSLNPTVEGPSEPAKMVCGDQPMDRLTSILDLKEDPHTVNNWADSTFTCTYHLDEGDLVISVIEAKDKATALTYFDALQALAEDATPIKGLASLGFPAYETANGSAVFQKDSFVLHVDATDFPAVLGPDNITRNALAYQLSTTILACWVEHH